MIGEDEAGALPSKFLGLFGVEHWGSVGPGSSYRVHIEYTDATCDFSRQMPEFDCAYESGIYTVGYRFRGRSIGQAVDSDSRMTTVGALFVTPTGTSWELIVRNANLNRDATVVAEPSQTIAPLASDVESIDLLYRQELFGGRLTTLAGFESRERPPSAPKDQHWRAMAEWVREF